MNKTRILIQKWLCRAARFRRDSGGNTAVLAALMIPGLILSMGASLDYMSAAHREERLNGIADAAALAAVTPSMMLQSDNTKPYPCTSSAADGVPYQTAYNVFNAQAANVANIGTVTPTVCITDVSNGTNIVRTATVQWTSTSNNVFSGVLGFLNMGIQGIASAKSTLSPRTNFYLMVDTSPSMELPATQDGINQMVALTPNESGGCAFACHETNPTSGDTNVQGGPDNFALAQAACITLRIDRVNDAVNTLLQVAPATASVNNTIYGVSVNVFNVGFANIFPLTTDFSNLSYTSFTKDGGPNCTTTAIPQYLTIAPLTVYSNNNLTASDYNSDEDTLFDTALNHMNSLMPDPGNGTSNKNDSPKVVLFIVSDAVPDYDDGGRKYIPIDKATDSNGVPWCTSIKNRGIRIAFLYLTYYDEPDTGGDSWYTTYIKPDIGQVWPSVQACASPGLAFQVQVGQDIPAAMNALFQKVVATAYLSQ